MEKSEPSLAPEWLRNGSLGHNSSHHVITSSHTDSSSISRSRARNSPNGLASFDPIRSSFLDRSSSSNSRKYFTNGSQKNAYSSFTRNHRDKDRDRERDRLNLNGSWDHDSSDNMGVSLRRSHSLVTRKQEDFPRNLGKSNGAAHKSVLEKDFPSLVTEEKQSSSDRVRGWTSVLVDDPNTLKTIKSSSSQINGNGALNMAEALTQAPPWHRASPQPSVQSQRREEMAIKQSKQLIPVTPSMAKLAKPLLRSSEVMAPTKQPHGNLLVLKPGWENGSLPKENTQTALNKSASSTVKAAAGERKPSPANLMPGFTLEKKPSLLQTQSRNDFFNHLKKKTALPAKPEPEPVMQNDAVLRIPEESFSEEETAFLRSLGWEENSGEEGLTEDEINSFYKEYMNRIPPLKQSSNSEEKVVG